VDIAKLLDCDNWPLGGFLHGLPIEQGIDLLATCTDANDAAFEAFFARIYTDRYFGSTEAELAKCTGARLEI